MSILKRAFALLIVLALAMPVNTTLAATGSSSGYEAAYGLLNALGCLPEGFSETEPDAAVTRAGFAHMIAGIRGVSGGKYRSDGGFLDVPKSHQYASDIYVLCELGIADGINEYKFMPDGNITYGEAAKIIVNLLGCQMKAELMYGGYPLGYMRMASELDILGASRLHSDYVTVQDAVLMCYDAAQSSFFEFEGLDGNNPVYKIDKNKTVFSQYCGLYKIEGILSDDGFTALDGKSSVSEQMLCIDGKSMKKGGVSTEGYLGMNVRAFYYDDDGVCELKYIYALPKNKVLEIYAEKLSDKSGNSAYTLVYFDEYGKERRANISVAADIIYNGVADTSLTVADIRINDGKLTLIDNNADGKYDVVAIFSYESFVVSYTDTKNGKIFGKYGECIVYKDADSVKVSDSTGSEITTDDIATGDTVMCAVSRDNNKITMYVSKTRVNGVVEQIYESDDGKNTYYVIGGREYTYSKTYMEAVAAQLTVHKELKVGNAYTFYVDYLGRISDVATGVNTALQYAYLLDVRCYEDEESGEDVTMLKLFTSTGNINRAAAAEKMYVNSEKIFGKDLADDTRIMRNKTTIRQLVQVKFNDLGEVKELYLSETPNEYGYNSGKFSLDYQSSSALYKGSSTWSFAGKYCVATNALIFFVPKGDSFDDEDIEIGSLSRLNSGSKYQIEVYDADASLTSSVIVVRNDSKNAGFDASLFVVDKVVTSLNENDEAVKQISGVQYGAYVTYVEKTPGAAPANVKKGDVARVSAHNGELTRLERITSLSDDPSPFVKYYDGASTLMNTYYTVQYGYLYGKSGSGITIVTPDEEVSSYGRLIGYSLNGGNVKVTVYDRNEGRATVGLLGDVASNSVIDKDGKLIITPNSVKVLVYRRLDYAREIVVVK